MLDYAALQKAASRTNPPVQSDVEITRHARRVRDKLLGRGPSGMAPREAVTLGGIMAEWERRRDWAHKHDRWTWRGWPEMAEPVSGEIAVAK
jgi:hypothetical protein